MALKARLSGAQELRGHWQEVGFRKRNRAPDRKIIYGFAIPTLEAERLVGESTTHSEAMYRNKGMLCQVAAFTDQQCVSSMRGIVEVLLVEISWISTAKSTFMV